MAISGNRDPNAGREVNLSQEAPSSALNDEILERIEMQAAVGDLSGRVAVWVRGRLLPTAELIALWFGTCLITLLTWAICHLEGFDKRITLSACALSGVAAFLTGRAFLLRRQPTPICQSRVGNEGEPHAARAKARRNS
jgi:hypothetical protein